jgi:MoxR-like ATPase
MKRGVADRALFTGSATKRAEPSLPEPLEPQLRAKGHYVPGKALARAVDVALLLSQPLLLTGEPGTGKTALAAALAHELFDDKFLAMQVKSGSGRDDLLYRIDEMARFRDAQPNRVQRRLLDYIEFRPLGEAIIRACNPDLPLRHRSGRELIGDESFLDEVFGKDRPTAVPRARDLLPEARAWTEPERWVVLVDELDKASRDMPNDLLEEFERMAFAIAEAELYVAPGEGALRPIVVVTSNSEKSLPDAFLRRCAYHHIPFPEEEELLLIVTSRLGDLQMAPSRTRELLALFREFRGTLQRRPGTAELLQWLTLADRDPNITAAASRASMVEPLVGLTSVVAKQEVDVNLVRTAIAAWAKAT